MKKEVLSNYQLKIVHLYNISIGNIKELVLKIFDKEQYLLHYEKAQQHLRLELKLETYICIIIQSTAMAKSII